MGVWFWNTPLKAFYGVLQKKNYIEYAHLHTSNQIHKHTMDFTNKFHVYHDKNYLFTIHYNSFLFELENIVQSQQGLVDNFSCQFELDNKFFTHVHVKDGSINVTPECNVHVEYENPELTTTSAFFVVEVKRLYKPSLGCVVRSTDTVGDLKEMCDAYPDQIKLTYNGVQMDNDDVKIGLYGINKPCNLSMVHRLGHADYHISRQPPQKEFKMKGDLICCMCLDKPSHYMFSPCNHLCACESCKNGIDNNRCPICRKDYKKIIRVYY